MLFIEKEHDAPPSLFKKNTMNWINIHTDTLRTEDFLGSEPTERATWLSLLAWCCAQENGGIIIDCKGWKDRMWQQLCGVTKSEVETKSFLFGFEGNNLVVNYYPDEAETKVKTLRENGRKGGRPKKRVPQVVDNKAEKPQGSALLNQMDTICLNEKKGKVREGKERKEIRSRSLRSLFCLMSLPRHGLIGRHI